VESLFSQLTEAVEGAAPLAAAAALLWGVLSLVLSPCHLAGIPLLVAYTGKSGDGSSRSAWTFATAFALGILVTIVGVGAITAVLGRLLGDVGRPVNFVLAGVFVGLGLHFLDVLPLPDATFGAGTSSRRGRWGAFGLGLVFGVGVGPCTFAYMAPMLGVTLKVAASRPLVAASLPILYAVGHCSVLVIAGTSVQFAKRALHWNEASGEARMLRRFCGVLVVLGGLYLLYTAP
jgi:cytochrome c-type biogenesis protein